MTEYNLNIIKADNGWVIRSSNYNPVGEDKPFCMIATNDEDLAQVIAGAIVSQRLVGASPYTEESYKRNVLRNISSGVYFPGGGHADVQVTPIPRLTRWQRLKAAWKEAA